MLPHREGWQPVSGDRIPCSEVLVHRFLKPLNIMTVLPCPAYSHASSALFRDLGCKHFLESVVLALLRWWCFPYRRRITSQRCSLEFLEDAVGCSSVQRYTPYMFLIQGPEFQLPLTPGATRRTRTTCFLPYRTKHASGSPRHKGLKKTHFIKNMRQYDTKNSR